MQIPKPTDTDRARFASLVPDEAGVDTKPMFGNLGAFVNGNMFMGPFGSDIGVKLAGADHDKLAAMPGAGPFGPADRPMGGYVTIPPIGPPARPRRGSGRPSLPRLRCRPSDRSPRRRQRRSDG